MYIYIYIEINDGDKTNLRRCNGMFCLDAWRVPHHTANDSNRLPQLSQRQGWIVNLVLLKGPTMTYRTETSVS